MQAGQVAHKNGLIFSDIHVRARIIHNRYGRGIVEALMRERGLARVLIDGESEARNVLLAHLVREPVEAFTVAPFAICWPLDRAGERVDPATVRR